MKISTLQSLIDRTSNQIAEYEAAIQSNLQPHFWSDGECEMAEAAVRYYRARLPKLRKIQNELKKEIAQKLRLQRGINHYRKLATKRRDAIKLAGEKNC